MIEFRNVSFSFNHKQVLKEVTFKVNIGEAVLLVGSSGEGKTTILKLILGLLKPDSGDVIVMDQDISKISEKELNNLRQKFGVVFQDDALFDSLTVEENVGFFLIENLKLPSEEVEKNVVKILKFLNMEDTRNLYPSELSGGMKKRVAIARAVVVNPEVLLYDEPVEGLDPITAKKVVDLINNLTEEYGYTSLIVTHEISHFQGSVNRLLLLDRKTITYDGKVDPEIFNQVEEFNKR